MAGGCSKKRYRKTSYICSPGTKNSIMGTINEDRIFVGSSPVSYISKGTTNIYNMYTSYLGCSAGGFGSSAGDVTTRYIATYYTIFSYAYNGLGTSVGNMPYNPTTFTPKKNQSVNTKHYSITISQTDSTNTINNGSKSTYTVTVNSYMLDYQKSGISVSESKSSDVWIVNPEPGYSCCYSAYMAYALYNGSYIYTYCKASYSVTTDPVTSPAAASTLDGPYLSAADKLYVSYAVDSSIVKINKKYGSSNRNITVNWKYILTYGVNDSGGVENSVTRVYSLSIYDPGYKILFINFKTTNSMGGALGVAFYTGSTWYMESFRPTNPTTAWSGKTQITYQDESSLVNASGTYQTTLSSGGKEVATWIWFPKAQTITYVSLIYIWAYGTPQFHIDHVLQITQTYSQNNKAVLRCTPTIDSWKYGILLYVN